MFQSILARHDMNADLNMLPNIRFRVNDTQVRLISTTIYKYAIIHLQKGVSCVVLYILKKNHLANQNSYLQENAGQSSRFLQRVSQIIVHRDLKRTVQYYVIKEVKNTYFGALQ